MNQKNIIFGVILVILITTPVVAQTSEYNWNNPCDNCNESNYSNPEYVFFTESQELESHQVFETQRVDSIKEFSKVVVWIENPKESTVTINLYNDDTKDMITQKQVSKEKIGKPIVFNTTPSNTPLNLTITTSDEIKITGIAFYTHQDTNETTLLPETISQKDLSGNQTLPEPNQTTETPEQDDDKSNGLFDSIFGIFFIIGIGILVLFLLLFVIGKIKQ